MTESPGNEPGSEVFGRIQQMVKERGVDIRQTQSGHALRLEFADGQRILINLDPQTSNVWLAARSGGIEFIYRDGAWLADDQGEFFAKLRQVIEQTIASNPANARAPSAKVPPAIRPEPVIYYEAKESHGFRNVLIVVLAATIGFWAAQKWNGSREYAATGAAGQTQTVALSRLEPAQQCERAFPANGSVTVFPESGLAAGGPHNVEVTLRNDHAHPVLLVLTPPQTVMPYLSVLVHARQSAAVQVPAGQYDLLFGVGTTWCNPRIGFSDGTMVKFNKPLTVQAGIPLQLGLQSSGAGPEDFQLFVKAANPEAEVPPPTFSGDGTMEVQRHPNGHFYLPATVENVPATFMVDTGASVTSVSSELARQAGIRNCKEVQFQTANGPANGCIALVARMTLGNFVLENITVAVMPNSETNLLGANVLRNFQVRQSDTSMLIGRR